MANDFYVHIVESPSPPELLNGITEGRALCEFLDLDGIPYSYNLAVDLDQFDIAMTDRVEEAIYEFRKIPILHLSMHGSEQGIQLANQYGTNDLISWFELAPYLHNIHKHLRDIHKYLDGLGVCMSCCGGAHGIKMAEEMRKANIPYQWIAGSFSDIDLSGATLAYAIFYRRHHRGIDNLDALRNLILAIRVTSGIADFDIWDGKLIQEAYRQERIEEIFGKGHISRHGGMP